jgi:hypothetical protein
MKFLMVIIVVVIWGIAVSGYPLKKGEFIVNSSD